MRAVAGVLLLGLLASVLLTAQPYDVLVYGATGSGVTAAVAAARAGASVALVEPGRFLGGMLTAGGGTPIEGTQETIGGYALEFYQRVGRQYGQRVSWAFEPHVGEQVLRQMLEEAGVKLFLEHELRDGKPVKRKGRRVRRIIMDNGAVFEARVYIDCTYEGDLAAEFKVPFVVGRETPVEKEENYSFALCLANGAANRVPFPKPASYAPERYDTWVGYIAGFQTQTGQVPGLADLMRLEPLPGGKVTAVAATGSVGAEYLSATRRQRAEMWQSHMNLVAGLFYFLSTNERVPETLRAETGGWGLSAEEHAYTNHWPHQMHIREARRMRSDSMLSWQDVGKEQPGTIGIGFFRGELFAIPYRAILPPREVVQNLLVVLSPAAGTGIAGVLRQEAVSMIVGHAAGVAASLAADSEVPVQDIDVAALRQDLEKQRAVLVPADR
jgi:hypothetical protein